MSRDQGETFLEIVDSLALPLATVAAVAQQAPAQPNARSSAQASEETLERIVVTAVTRQSTVQPPPVGITAISGEDLLARRLTGAQEIHQHRRRLEDWPDRCDERQTDGYQAVN